LKDVVVVGAGISGLYLARRFAEQGSDVTVLERKESIGNSNCSGHYGEKLFELMPESEKLVTNETDDLSIGNSKGYHSHERDDRIGATMEREDLDALAAEKAREAGVEIN
jgi:flavin-dependent dehydrogenase